VNKNILSRSEHHAGSWSVVGLKRRNENARWRITDNFLVTV
jgi:hypothetical protein